MFILSASCFINTIRARDRTKRPKKKVELKHIRRKNTRLCPFFLSFTTRSFRKITKRANFLDDNALSRGQITKERKKKGGFYGETKTKRGYDTYSYLWMTFFFLFLLIDMKRISHVYRAVGSFHFIPLLRRHYIQIVGKYDGR